MSAYTIIPSTLSSIDEKAEDAIMSIGNKYMMNARFAVGKKPNLDEAEEIIWLNRILQTASCHTSCNETQIKEILNKITNC